MDRVRDLVALGGVSVVLAQDRDRIAREPAYHYLLKREFAEHGTRLAALNDRGDESPEGELTDGILDQLAKYELAKIVERSRRRKLRKAREGKVVAGHTPNYGRVGGRREDRGSRVPFPVQAGRHVLGAFRRPHALRGVQACDGARRPLPQSSSRGSSQDATTEQDTPNGQAEKPPSSKRGGAGKARKSQVELLKTLAVEWRGENGVERLENRLGKPLKDMTRAEADEWIDRLTPEGRE
jgi:Resolvase, N terminal domain